MHAASLHKHTKYCYPHQKGTLKKVQSSIIFRRQSSSFINISRRTSALVGVSTRAEWRTCPWAASFSPVVAICRPNSFGNLGRNRADRCWLFVQFLSATIKKHIIKLFVHYCYLLQVPNLIEMRLNM